jgi:hypothetical protein
MRIVSATSSVAVLAQASGENASFPIGSVRGTLMVYFLSGSDGRTCQSKFTIGDTVLATLLSTDLRHLCETSALFKENSQGKGD